MRWSAVEEQTNLGRFLREVTPRPLSRSLAPSCANDVMEYFELGDLWHCYNEWSAFGLGTQVELTNSESVTQYYVPYLSAIQIYTNKTMAPTRTVREDNEAVETESGCWSDDSGSENLSRSLSNDSSKTWDAVLEDSNFEPDNTWPMRDRLGYLYFQYFETSSPYWRVPLADKMTELARKHPGLTTLRSVDMAPASWMAVSWYPIYHIPSRKNEKDLSSCFLTYHTLSSSFQDNPDEGENTKYFSEEPETKRIPLAPFGLATYKMQGDLWAKPETRDLERLVELLSSAGSWLKQLSVHHHDYNFFAVHSTL